MFISKRIHDAGEDFPVLPGKVSKYESKTNAEIVLRFNDVTIVMPSIVMYFLDNKEALGWEHNWKPDDRVVDRIMRGGFAVVRDYVDPGKELPTIFCGYLRRVEGGRIIDTCGGDANYDGMGRDGKGKTECPLANFGATPPEFVKRLQFYIRGAWQGYFSKVDIHLPYCVGMSPASGYDEESGVKVFPARRPDKDPPKSMTIKKEL